ncbi:hypothetical protein ABT026_32025 [Streptomyces sp. NPDC002734]|uniref:hypothetical protein n=1 Tax=unclassified Streptomyces TaxID=2593676 RepID=UPI0033284AB7
MNRPHIVVHPPGLDGSRRVTADDEALGVASHLDDVREILRLSDLDAGDVETGDRIDWQGGGPGQWPGLEEHHDLE